MTLLSQNYLIIDTYKWNLHAKFQVSTPKGVAYSVRTERKKRVFDGFWGAKRPIFELNKNHS